MCSMLFTEGCGRLAKVYGLVGSSFIQQENIFKTICFNVVALQKKKNIVCKYEMADWRRFTTNKGTMYLSREFVMFD